MLLALEDGSCVAPGSWEIEGCVSRLQRILPNRMSLLLGICACVCTEFLKQVAIWIWD